MKTKRLILIVAALVALVAILLGVFYATRPETQVGQKEIVVTVVHSDGSEKDYPITTTQEYVGRAIVEAGIAADNQDQYGLYLEELDGERAVWAENGAYWAFYVGEEYAVSGLDQTPVTDGTTYKLVYTIG